MADGESIFITGASTGIGLALAEQWLARGHHVFALQRRASPLFGSDRYHEELADLGDLAALPRQVESLLAGVTRLDRVVLNGAIGTNPRDLGDTPLAEVQHVMNVNTWSNKLILDQLFSSGIRVRQVVGISSGAAVRGSRGWGGYSLSKAAFAMLIQLYAAERPETHFCSLMPGIVQTRMQDDLASATAEQRRLYPSLERLIAARGTPDMPLPDVVAPALLAAFDGALKEPSGALLDYRKLQG
jgi:benzil reductase ((S)-benzoin forming)